MQKEIRNAVLIANVPVLQWSHIPVRGTHLTSASYRLALRPYLSFVPHRTSGRPKKSQDTAQGQRATGSSWTGSFCHRKVAVWTKSVINRTVATGLTLGLPSLYYYFCVLCDNKSSNSNSHWDRLVSKCIFSTFFSHLRLASSLCWYKTLS